MHVECSSLGLGLETPCFGLGLGPEEASLDNKNYNKIWHHDGENYWTNFDETLAFHAQLSLKSTITCENFDLDPNLMTSVNWHVP